MKHICLGSMSAQLTARRGCLTSMVNWYESPVVHLNRRSQRKAFSIYDPQALWGNVVAVIREATQQVPTRQIIGIGIASMAETGMLVDRKSGAPRTEMLPWLTA